MIGAIFYTAQVSGSEPSWDFIIFIVFTYKWRAQKVTYREIPVVKGGFPLSVDTVELLNSGSLGERNNGCVCVCMYTNCVLLRLL